MTARKTIRRSSRYSLQSQASGVLNPDSSISEIGDNTFWFRDFKDDSVIARPSQRFGAVQDDPVLNPDSEPEATPLRKSWWKELDDTKEARRSMGNASRSRSSVSEKSLDASDLAVMNEGVSKPRSKMPRVKRKSSGRNVFSDILASTSRASSSREDSRVSENKDRESSVSLTDSSVERVRQPPLKKKKMTIRDLASGSDSDGPDIFQDALEAPESENTNSRQDSFKKGEVPSDISEATTIADSDLEGRKSPLISHPKKRTIFAKTGPRKSAHFDDLLMNAQSEDEPSIRRDAEGDRNKSQVESRKESASRLASGSDFSIEEDDSISDDSIQKQRPVFPRKKQGTQEDRIAALLSESSEIQPIAQKKTQEFLHLRDVSASEADRQSSKQRNNRSRTSGSLNSEPAECQAPRTLSSANKSGKETNNRTPTHVEDEEVPLKSDSDERSISEREEEDIRPPGPSDHEIEDSQPPEQVARRSSTVDKSDKDRRSREEASDQEQSSGPESDEHHSVRTEISARKDTPSRKGANDREESPRSEDEENRSSRTEVVARKDRRSRTEASDRDESLGSEDEENRSVRTETSNRSHRRSVNKKNDRSRASESQDGNDGDEASDGANESEDQEEQTMIVEEDPVENDGMEEAQPPEKSHRESSRINESDVVEDSQPPRRPQGRLIRSNDLGKGRESGNEGIALEKSSGSPDTEVGRNSSPILSVRRSGSANKSRDSTQGKSQSKISERQSNNQDQRTPSRVEGKSTGQDSPVSDEEEEDDEISQRSGLIARPQTDGEGSPGLTRPEATETIPTNREPTIQPISPSTPAEETGARRKSTAIIPRRSILAGPPKKGVDKTARIMENTEMSESRFFSTPIRRADEASASGTVQQSKTTGGLFTGDKLTLLKAKLEQVKRQESANLKYIHERKAILKNTKIDSYFKTTSDNGSARAKTAKKKPSEPKPVNKAYIMDGIVLDSRRPRLSRPKSWATDRLYKFLWKKLEPKYNISTRVRSEKFVKNLSEVSTIIQRRKKYENYKSELNKLLREMAHLGIIDTRNDFNIFCQEFLPYEFRIKVIPMILPGDVRNIPFHPDKLHTPILDSLD